MKTAILSCDWPNSLVDLKCLVGAFQNAFVLRLKIQVLEKKQVGARLQMKHLLLLITASHSSHSLNELHRIGTHSVVKAILDDYIVKSIQRL